MRQLLPFAAALRSVALDGNRRLPAFLSFLGPELTSRSGPCTWPRTSELRHGYVPMLSRRSSTYTNARPWAGGLLGPSSTEQFYARTLDLEEAARLLTTPGLLWQAAEADVQVSTSKETVEQYLLRVEQSSQSWLDVNELHDRTDVQVLDSAQTAECERPARDAVSGKSLAKSFLLRKLAAGVTVEANKKVDVGAAAEQQDETALEAVTQGAAEEAIIRTRDAADRIRPRRVVVYDARDSGNDLVKGLLKAFSGNPTFFAKYITWPLIASSAVGSAVTTAGGAVAETMRMPGLATAAKVVGDAADAIVKALVDKNLPLEDVVEAFVTTCEAEGTFPCLIVDEANVAFAAGEGKPDGQAQQDRARTLAALRLLTKYTKQARRMNVIFPSSDYSEPYRLSALGFKSDNFTETVLMPEISPKDMRVLLKEKWGMGDNLATAFMAVWGGHIWAASKGISRLVEGKAKFKARQNPIAFSPDALDGVVTSLDGRPVSRQGAGTPPPPLESSEKAGIIDLLRLLAVRGIVPVPSRTDRRAQLVGFNNVGGVIAETAISPGLPSEAWEAAESGIAVVATTQAMRMLLARHLHAKHPA